MLNLSLVNLYMLLFQGQKRKYLRTWLSHISIQKVQPLCKLMPPKRDLEQSYYKTPDQSCLHHGPWLELEKNYQNLERECLAMIWGMEEFHYFLYGKQFTLETDQKPLVSTYKKHMVEISPRIQRLIVRSFPYQLFDVQYRRGKEIPLADALSRVTPIPVEEDGIQLPIVAVNLITSNIPVSSTEIELICEETCLKILHSHFWDITFIWDGQLIIGCFLKSFTHSGITEKTCQWRTD